MLDYPFQCLRAKLPATYPRYHPDTIATSIIIKKSFQLIILIVLVSDKLELHIMGFLSLIRFSLRRFIESMIEFYFYRSEICFWSNFGVS